MTGDDVQIESAAGELTSGVQVSSARMLKEAYQPTSLKRRDAEPYIPFFKTPSRRQDEETPGPDAKIYITKISTRTSFNEVKRILGAAADREMDIRNYDFFTFLFYINIQLDEPSTTRFINAIVSFTFSPAIKILDYSPKEKEIITQIAETAGDRIIMSPSLDFHASILQDTGGNEDPDKPFSVRVGPDEEITLTYSKKNGYIIPLPEYELLEYEGMRRNEHEVYWEIYPPMPPDDSEIPGKGKHAILSLIVQAPCNSRPVTTIHVNGKVKGEIWGVVPVEGSVVF